MAILQVPVLFTYCFTHLRANEEEEEEEVPRFGEALFKVIGCITGAVWVQENAKASRHDRVDVGLNLKHNAKMLCVSGFCRPMQGDKSGWEYSQETLRVLQEYKEKYECVLGSGKEEV